MGRRVYWGCVIIVVMTLRQGRLCGASLAKLVRMFSISHQTIKRWIAWFRDEFPQSAQWHQLRGRVVCTVSNENLPASLVLYFLNHFPSTEQALVACLKLLATDSQGLSNVREG
jgi:hypothetical protein